MSSFFEDLIKRRQEELKNVSGRRDDSSLQNDITPKVNLFDLIKRVQDEKNNSVARVPRRVENNQNNVNSIANNNLNKVKVDSNLNNNVPKTKEDIDKMVYSMNKVNQNIKEKELNNIKNFNNQAYSQGQLKVPNNLTKVKVSDLRNQDKKPLFNKILKVPESFDDNLDLFDDGYNFGDITRTGLRYVGDTAGAMLGTVGDVALGATKGVADIAGNAVDLIGGGVAGIADLAGNKDFANKLRKSIASGAGHYASNTIGDWQKTIDKYSAIGDKGDEITESLGYMGALGALGAPGGKTGKLLSNGAMFVSGAGGGLQEAYQKGATGGQAFAKAIGSGTIEALTENMFGLFGNVDTKFVNGIVGKIKNGFAKNFARAGLNATGEGAEEVISSGLNYIGDRIIDFASQGKGVKFAEDFDWNKTIDEASIAAITAFISGGGSTAINIINNKNATNTWTDAINKTADQQAKFAQKEELNDELEKLNNKLKKTTDSAETQKIQNELKWKSKQLNALTNNNLVDVIKENANENSNAENGKVKYSIAGTNGMENAIKQDTSYLQLERNYNKAQQMQKIGIDNETIRQNTNWFQDKNGDWKFEFSDKDMTLKENVKLEKNKIYRLGDILKHDTLFEIYPELRELNIKINDTNKISGKYNKNNNTITLSNRLLDNRKNMEGTLIHEIQHAIQNVESFENGTTAKLSKKNYYNSLGEIEADNTRKRFVDEKYYNKDISNEAPESSKTNPKHRNYNNYMNNRNMLDKIKDGMFKYFKGDSNEIFKENNQGNLQQDIRLVDDRRYGRYVNDKNGGKSNEVNQEMVYTDKGHNIPLVDERYRVLNNKNGESIQNKTRDGVENQFDYSIDKLNNKMSQNGFSDVLNNKKLPMQSFVYEKSDNPLVDTFRKDISKYWVNTDKAHNIASTFEKLIVDKGIGIRLNSNLKTEDGRVADASFSNETITINPNSNRAGEFLAIHELTHAIGTQQMLDMVDNYRHFDTEFNESVKSLIENYKASELTEEALADVSGQLFGNQEFINNLSQKNPNLFKRIYNEIKYLWHQFRGYKNQNQFINDLHYKWEQAYRKNSKFNDSINYSIQTDNNGNKYVKIDTDQNIFEGIDKKDYNKIAKMYMQDYLMGETTLNDTDSTVIDSKSANKYTNPRQRTSYMTEKMKLTPELKNVLEIAQKESASLPTKDTSKYKSWEYYKFNFELDGKNFEGTVNIGIDRNGNKHFYEINKIRFTGISSVSTNSQHKTDFINNSILPTKEDVNRNTTKYSMQESENNSGSFKLSTKQWGQYLNDNFKVTGTRTNLSEIKLPTKEWLENRNNDNIKLPTKEYFENKEKLNTNPRSKTKYHISENFSAEIDKALNNKLPSNTQVKARDYTPKILVNNGVQDLPMLITQKHIKSTVYTLQQAKSLKLPVKNINYHGLGKELLIKAIDNLDNPQAIYKTNDNNYLIVTEFKDRNNKEIIVPIQINAQGRYNSVFIDENQIKSVYGRNNLKNYIENNNFTEIYKKNKELDFNEGIQYSNVANSSKNSISSAKLDVNTNTKYSIPESENNTKNSIKNNTNNLINKFNEMEATKNTYEKIARKEKLSEKDSLQVERLLKDEITFDELPKNSNKEGILRVYNAKKPYVGLKNYVEGYKKQLNAKRIEVATNAIKNIDSWKDKTAGLQYNRETARRNIYDIMSKSDADNIYSTYFEPYAKHEAEVTRDINRYNETIENLNIGTTKKYKLGNEKVSESALVQMFGEGRISLDVLKSTGADVTKIENATKVFRQVYDELFDRLNKSSVENGYNPILKKKDYFPHFTENKPDTLLSKIASKVGIDLTNQELPTDIAGITAQFKPGRKWMGNLLHRYSDITDFDALKGFDNYVRNATDIIYHTSDTKNLRALENAIRYNYSEDGLKEQLNKIRDNDTLDDFEKAAQVQALFKDRDVSHLSHFVTWLNQYTNGLAGKKSMDDRNWEYNLGRNIYSTMANLESRSAANMIAGNVRVALTNFGALGQSFGEIKGVNLLNGAWSTLKNTFKRDGSFANSSDFITNRRGTDSLMQSSFDNFVEVVTKPLNAVDDFVSETIVRSKYYDNLQKGMSQEEALHNADEYTAGLMADRSKGQLPIAFNSKNPIAKLNNMFQVEVNNQWSYYFKDLPRNCAEGKFAKVRLAYSYAKAFVGVHIFCELFKKIVGGNNSPTLDPLNIVKMLVGGLGNDDDSDDVETVRDVFGEILGNVPFMSVPIALFGSAFGIDENNMGGKVPALSVIPNVGKIISTATSDSDIKYKKQVISKELSKPGYNLLPPAFGGQAKKTVEAIKTMADGGSYFYDKEGNKVLQFPTEDLSVGDKIRAGLFGKYALPTANTYSERGYKSLNAKQTKLYEETKLPYKQLLDYIDAGLTKTSDKIDYVNSNDMTTNQKWGIYKYNIFSSSTRKDGSSQITDADYITKNGVSKSDYMKLYDKAITSGIDMPTADEYDEFKALGISLKDYVDYKIKYKGSDINDSKKLSLLLDSDYSNSNIQKIYEKYLGGDDNTEYGIMKSSGINIKEYLKYKQQKFESDKEDDGTVNGKSVSGSKKKKVYEYVNSMKISYNQRLLLLGQQYKLNDDERTKLAKYVNSMKLSKNEKLKIYSKLQGFTVMKDGTVKW